jgi:hypothetical protein
MIQEHSFNLTPPKGYPGPRGEYNKTILNVLISASSEVYTKLHRAFIVGEQQTRYSSNVGFAHIIIANPIHAAFFHSISDVPKLQNIMPIFSFSWTVSFDPRISETELILYKSWDIFISDMTDRDFAVKIKLIP